MPLHVPIIELKATYYDFVSKKWVPGVFSLNSTHVRFHIDGNDDSFKNLSLSLRSISGIERKQCTFIYPAIIITSGNEKYWFASFSNRDAVFNVVELFWKQPLFSNSPSQPKTANSALGKELLDILHESESSLTEAASALSNQGRQLQESEAVLSDVNADLTKAHKIIKNMSFLGPIGAFFSTKPKTSEICEEQECRQKHFSVTYIFDKSRLSLFSWEAGTLIGGSGLVLLDELQHKKISLSSDEVKKISVLTPWELCIIYNSNNSIKSCNIMCSQLNILVKFLWSFPAWKNKITQEENSLFISESGFTAASRTVSSLPSVVSLHSIQASSDEQMQDLQVSSTVQDQESVVSEEDMNEISNMLNNLQAIATDVCREQKDQMDKINNLITGVEKTELRIKAHSNEIKKLM